MTQDINLSSIFKAVTKILSQNEESLNQADTYNHDHGTNMVNTFKLVQKAVSAKKDQSASEQLAYASQVLRDNSTSGSAQVYAQGLENASNKFVGKEVTKDTVGTLISAMMGMDQTAQPSSSAANGNLLGSLLGSLTGAEESSPETNTGDLISSLLSGLGGSSSSQLQSESDSGNMINSLFGSLTGSQQSDPDGLDVGDLLSVGAAYYSAKQQGGSTMEAIMQALSSASPLGQREDRKQSGALVINTILNMLGKK